MLPAFTEEQRLLKESLERFRQQDYAFEKRKGLLAKLGAKDDPVWAQLRQPQRGRAAHGQSAEMGARDAERIEQCEHVRKQGRVGVAAVGRLRAAMAALVITQ